MSRKPQEEIFDPFGELTESGLSRTEVIESWRAQCWGYYLNGGGGDPFYFDYYTVGGIRQRQGERQ